MKNLAQAQPAIQRRAAIYVRVSTQGQEEDGTSLQTQEARCREYASQHGYVVDETQVYREVHTGTQLWERKRLSQMRDAVRRGQVGVVVTYAIDRLSRDPVHLGVVISEADHAGVEVEFVSEPLDNSPEGQLIRFVRGYAAKIDHTKIVERTMRGRRARAEAGKLLPGARPVYGYRWNADRTGYVVDPETASVVRRIFREFIAGKPTRHIALGLTADGIPVPTNNGRDWYTTQVIRVLRNHRYTGRAEAFYWQAPDGGGKSTARPPEERIALPEGTIPPLVDQDLFDAVGLKLSNNKRFASRNNRDPEATLLRGFARCGYCDHAMTAHRAGPKHRWYYQCSQGGWAPTGCKAHSIIAHLLDADIWTEVEAVLRRPEIIAERVQMLRRDDPTEAELTVVDKTLTDIARQQGNLARSLALLDDEEGAAPIRAELSRLAANKRQLESERASIAGRRALWQAAQERLGDLERWCHAVAARLGSLTYQDKRQALEMLNV